MMQPQYTIAAARKLKVVGDDKGSEPVLSMKSLHQSEHHLRGSVIQVTCWLISHQDSWACHQGPGQGHPLLLTAGKLSSAMMAAALQSNFPQPFAGFLHGLTVSGSLHQERHCNILLRRKFRQQVVKLPDKADGFIAKISGCVVCKLRYRNLGAVYVTCGSTIKSTKDVQQAALAGAGLAHDSQHFPLPHLEEQVFKEH